jgi:hypothetical protein
MALDKLVRLTQLAGALLATPVAATGAVSVYRSYFSSDVHCQTLRSTILTTMDKNVPPPAKIVLLRKDVDEFEKNCAKIDPDADAIFRTTMQQLASRANRAEVAPAAAPPPQPPSQSASAALNSPPVGAPAPGTPRAANTALPLFNLSTASQSRGWVVIIRGDRGHKGEPNFEGYSIASLPPVGTVLNARRMLWVWSEPRGDPSNVQARLNPGACVRVLSTRLGPIGAWAEVVPAPCS